MRPFSPSAWSAVFDRFVHQSAKSDPLALQLHRAFIVSRLIGAGCALALFPVCFVWWGVVSALDLLTLLCLAAPVVSAVSLSESGDLEKTQAASSLATIATIGLLAWFSGGLNLALVGWLIVTVAEAALTGSRRVMTIAFVAGAGSAVSFAAAVFLGLLPEAQEVFYAPLVMLSSAACLIGNAYVLSARLDHARAHYAEMQQGASDTYRLIADHAPDMISLHSRNGNVLFASPAAKILLGDATALFERVHVQDRTAFLSLFERASEEGAPDALEFRLRDLEDGKQWNWVEMRCAPLGRKGQGAPLQFVAVTRSLGSRKVREEELARLSIEADKANAVKTRFLAHVSHELRTPLNAIIGFSEMMTQKDLMLPPEKQREYSALIQESGKHLLDVVNTMLDLSKIEAGAFSIQAEPFQPVELVEKCLAMMEPAAADAGVRLKRMRSAAMPEILADRRACMQIFLNLLSNAVKFTPPGGEVRLALQSDDNSVTFIVSDTGIGIDEHDLPHLAQPFVQAQSGYERRHEGAGLGLSLVKSLSELQGGKLRISSKRGQGTLVSVTLPRCAPAAKRKHIELEPLKAAV